MSLLDAMAAIPKETLPMNDVTQLDLDLSALPLDDFEVADQDLTVESLTAGIGFKPCSCDCSCCHFCACPCVCC